LEPGHGYGLGCLIAIIVFYVIWDRFLGDGWSIGLPWYNGGGPVTYVDKDIFDDEVNPNPKWWRKRPEDERIREPTAPRPYDARPGFVDDKLDALIEAGDLGEAREYLAGMIAISIEMKDKQSEANYRAYDKRIENASMQGRRLAHHQDDPGNDVWNE
jgi:hypothetical protein